MENRNATSNSARARLRSRTSPKRASQRAPHLRSDTSAFARQRRQAAFNKRTGVTGSSRIPQLMSSSKQEQAMRRNIMRRNSPVIQSLPIIALVLVIIAVIAGIVYFNGTIQ
jgi:hypothetical protein